MTPPTTDNTLTLSERECYWAILEPPTSRPSTEALRYAFEPHLPVSLNDIEARFARLDKRRWLACGVERERLDRSLAEAEAASPIDSVRPAAFPTAALMALADMPTESLKNAVGAIQFRSGAYESPHTQRWKRAAFALAAITLFAGSSLVGLGVLNRTTINEQRAAEAANAARLLAANLTASDANADLDPRLRLAAELRSLERTRDASASDLLPPDRSSAFIAVLAALPPDVPVSLDALDVDEEAITLRGRVRDASDYEALTTALAGLGNDWSTPTGSVSRARQGYTFTIAIRYAGDPQ